MFDIDSSPLEALQNGFIDLELQLIWSGYWTSPGEDPFLTVVIVYKQNFESVPR